MAGNELTISKLGYARYKVNPINGEIKLPADWSPDEAVLNNIAESFKFIYRWDSASSCRVYNFEWYPVTISVDNNGQRIINQYIDRDDENNKGFSSESPFGKIFTTDNSNIKFSIQINGVELIDKLNANQKTLNWNNASASNDNISYSAARTSVINSNSYAFYFQGVGTSYIFCNFLYEYTIPTNNEDLDNYSTVTYYVKIDNIKIPKISKYEHNVIFTEDGLNELITNIKKYPITDIISVNSNDKDSNNRNIWNTYTSGKPCIRINYGDTSKTITYGGTIPQTVGHKYVAVGSNITFPNETTPLPESQATGTIRISIDGTTHEIPVYGLAGTGSGGINLNGTTTVTGHLLPSKNAATTPAEWNIGATNKKWHTIYALNGNFTNLTVNGNNVTSFIPSSNGTKGQFWRGGGSDNPSWSNELIGPMIITSASGPSDNNQPTNAAPTSTAGADFRCTGAGYFGRNLTAAKVFNAVFNDYAEYRSTINLTPGHVVIDQDDGSLICSFQRLQSGAQIISDTFGHSMGYTKNTQTPLAVAGRVLAYTYQSRENYHAGMAVCSAPNGTVDIMTREEIRDYPDCIVGIVSEIPQYETWGTDNVKVDGRIWIKVK